MKNIFLRILLLVIGVIAAVSCTDGKESTAAFDVQFDVPESVTINFDETEFSFRVMFGKAPLKTDKLVLGDPAGTLRTCDILATSSSSFTISLYSGMASGKYNVYIQRGSLKKQMGSMEVTITYNSGSGQEIDVAEGNNVYGVVSCGGKGIEGVVVSDGVEVVKTDKEGVYQFKSAKKHKYVFVSVPSGYEAVSEGVLPRIHQQLTKSSSVKERVDFSLVESGDQTNHTMLVFGDMHLANRTGDRSQFTDFTTDVNSYLAANQGDKVYGLTLGDMTWELYWLSNSYGFNEYISDVNAIKGLQIFHTMGNHDNEMEATGDFYPEVQFKKALAPTYYSFNIGKVHYVVLDDILANYDGTSKRDYSDKLTDEQLEWLKKDLSYVSTSTPLVVASHAPVYGDSGSNSLNNASELENILKAYDKVHIFTGHTHKMYNIDKLSDKHIFEHNAGAVCATWWWTGKESDIHLAQDGAPGGYSIVDVTATDFSWQFKATDFDVDHQFRTYDRNTISLKASKYTPSADAEHQTKFESEASDWVNPSTANEVYFNIWNYDPSWTIEVTENGKQLTWEKVSMRDPLHLVAYNAARLNKNAGLSFGTSVTKHMFKVTASSATSTIDFKITDRFGNVYTETMTRPKEFSIDIYR